MPINITLSTSNEIPWQESTWWDKLALVAVISGTIILFLTWVILYLKSTYAPLRAKDTPKLIIMCLAGIFHMWGTFMAHDHFKETRTSQLHACYVWTFWVAYFFGLNVWFVLVILRHEAYLRPFSKMWQDMPAQKFRQVQVLTVLVLTVPFGIYCFFVSVLGGEYWDHVNERCVSSFAWKAPLLMYVILCLATLVLLNAWLKAAMRRTEYKEDEAINAIVRLCVLVIVVNGFISMFGALSYSAPRSVATLLVVALHVGSMWELCAFEVYKALANDAGAENAFIRYHRNAALAAPTAMALIDDPLYRADFVDYCHGRDVKEYKAQQFGNTQLKFDPKPVVDLYRAIQLWNQTYDAAPPERCLRDYVNICEDYLVKDAPRYVYIDDKGIYDHALTRYGAYRHKKSNDNLNLGEYPFETHTSYIDDSGEKPKGNTFYRLCEWIPARLADFYGHDYLHIDMFSRNVYLAQNARTYIDVTDTPDYQRKRYHMLADVLKISTAYPFEGADRGGHWKWDVESLFGWMLEKKEAPASMSLVEMMEEE